ncbi:MAG: hypothetical protein ABH813_01860 [Patescibacteria group bacterium]
MQTIKITLALIMILNLFAPVLCLGQMQLLNQPQDLNEAKQVGKKALEVGKKDIPGLIEKIWQDEVLPVWQKMFDWARVHIWENWLDSELNNLWQKVVKIFKEEADQRKPVIEEKFQKEKQELKEEAPQVGKSLWEKFKELIK